jgi:carboxypeptidase family protein
MRNVIITLACVVCLSATTSAALAQSQLGAGSISGTVSDSNGAVITGATVTITNAGTGLARTLTTGDAGQFSAPALPVGEYAARVEKTGFATLEQKGLIVNVGGTTTLRLELKPGAANEVVNIVAEQTIDAARTEETTLINRTQINDLPINGRRADQFALLAPGVTRDGRFGLLSYRGQSGVFNNFTLEGNDDNQAYFSEARGRTRIASNISANAAQEFQVAQSNFLPEFGRSAGGGINATVRSGANTFHGDGFWYFRNETLNARDPLATINPEERRDQFGGSFSGLVVKDKLFFFLNYDQQLRDFPLIIEDLSGVLTTGLPANATAQEVDDFNRAATDLRSRFPNGAPGNTVPRSINQNLGLAKIDWNASRSNIVSFKLSNRL